MHRGERRAGSAAAQVSISSHMASAQTLSEKPGSTSTTLVICGAAVREGRGQAGVGRRGGAVAGQRWRWWQGGQARWRCRHCLPPHGRQQRSAPRSGTWWAGRSWGLACRSGWRSRPGHSCCPCRRSSCSLAGERRVPGSGAGVGAGAQGAGRARMQGQARGPRQLAQGLRTHGGPALVAGGVSRALHLSLLALLVAGGAHCVAELLLELGGRRACAWRGRGREGQQGAVSGAVVTVGPGRGRGGAGGLVRPALVLQPKLWGAAGRQGQQGGRGAQGRARRRSPWRSATNAA